MTLHRALMIAFAIPLAFNVSACGGGGGVEIASALLPPPVAALPPPPPPPSLPPPPAPPPPGTVVGPAAAAALAVPAFPQAVAGGPTIATPGSSLLPLLQSVMVSDSAKTGPDLATMNGGSTLVLDPSASRATFNIANSAAGVSNAVLTKEPRTVFYETSGNTVIRLDFGALDWTAWGGWTAYPGGTNPVTKEYSSNFVTGFQTPGNAVPTTGPANYTGHTRGYVYVGGSGVSDTLAGTANLQANFATGTISGTLSDMKAGDYWYLGESPWNSVSLSASFAGGQSRFAGTTAVTSAPNINLALAANATGTVVGSFFGPNAQEIGAVWTLFDGAKAATGTIGAKIGP